MDTLGFEPRAFRMRSGCDTTTPCARLRSERHGGIQHSAPLRHGSEVCFFRLARATGCERSLCNCLCASRRCIYFSLSDAGRPILLGRKTQGITMGDVRHLLRLARQRLCGRVRSRTCLLGNHFSPLFPRVLWPPLQRSSLVRLRACSYWNLVTCRTWRVSQ